MRPSRGNVYAGKLARYGFVRGRILDAGCGFGATVSRLARLLPEAELVGVDLSEPLLTLAREETVGAEGELRIRFEKANVQAIPYGDDSFDVVISANMAHLVEDPVAMLDELERVLAPGGFLFVADLRRTWLGWVEREIRSALTMREVRDLLARSRVRPGTLRAGLLWWRFESNPTPAAERGV
jgi:ubiquinone/menaquinone biosynthesis C-methylase UbiE